MALPIIETLSSTKAYATPYMHVDEDKVRFPDGREGVYSVLSNAGNKGAVIVPLAASRGIGYFGLVKQYRYPLKDFTLELPRGGAADLEEGGAKAEVLEELGEDPQRLTRIGTIYPDTGILSTEVGVWVAIMNPSVIDLDHQEAETGLVPEWVQEGRLDGMFTNGDIKCGISLAAYGLFKLNRGKFGSLLDAPF